MNIKDFYAKYNLNNECFSRMAHVGVNTLKKYSRGETIRDDAKERIESSMRTIIEFNHVRPKRKEEHHRGFVWQNAFERYEYEFQYPELYLAGKRQGV